jgi:hypothetical protein
VTGLARTAPAEGNDGVEWAADKVVWFASGNPPGARQLDCDVSESWQ